MDDTIPYRYRPLVTDTPETCDAPGCERPAVYETFSVVGTFLTCSTECADRTH